ncbi:DUF6605 domain-containing protein [Nocardioides sp. HM23]|uniref:N,N-dimethylformamidase beta subunit family domain-containing protein n=1 Tax=Nocardioides bizhenqiangii TaxID=3095076 RepID=UPI002ACAB75C|nr:N,N-dimethylformamidase beta subunit family domain-containing protein [Nocardioides sp. HM23]MDZ5622083.1 DUF6605 domain-containing protein [Nocardioides sp. HM23]
MRTSMVAAGVAAALLVSGCGSGSSAGPTERAEQAERAERAAGPDGERPVVDADAPDDESAEDLVGSDDWRLGPGAFDGRIEAYATRASAPAGTRVGLKVSTSADTWRVSAYRIGAYRHGWGHLVWRSRRQQGQRQAEAVLSPAATRTVVAPWRRSLVLDTTGWPEGYYVLKLRTGTGSETQVPYIVSSRSAEGTVALVAPVTTWQAYNKWGGYSLYEGPDGGARSWAVSFDRPYNGAPGANDYRSAALPIVVRAESLGVPLSYFANIDLDARPAVLAGARGYVSMGHDEYWTTGMRRTVMQARDAGTNLAFLGANTMYWRIRLSSGPSGANRTVIGYRSDAYLDPLRDRDPANATSRFRDPPVARPEHDLVGMQYECYPVEEDYVVVTPGWWAFRGTGMERGDRIEELVGLEADRVYPDRLTPRPMQVLSHTTYDCRGVITSSQSVYYTTPSGAGVFAAGTLRWGCALIDSCEDPLGDRARSFVGTVTENLLRGYAVGPVGLRHPAHDNLHEFDLPTYNTVSAS